jgi:enterochelin esterase family protein
MSSTSAQLAARLLTLSLVFGFYAATTSPSQQSQEPQERKTVTVDARVYDAYVGQYELAPKTLLTLRREKHHFMAQITGQPPFEIFPESETKFFWKVVEAQFVIEKDKDGKVEGLLFEQGAVKLKAKKISNELPKEVELPEPVDVIESPLLVALAKELKNGNREALAKFWDDRRDKGPLVEPLGNETRKSRVTFLWRGDDKTRRVSLEGGLPTVDNNKWLTRLMDTDLWYRTERMPNDARFTYSFQINRPLKMPQSGDLAGVLKVMEHCPLRLDPLNPRDVTQQGMLFSMMELPDAPPQPWVERLPGIPKGALKEQKIKSEPLKGERTVTVYTPADYDPKGEECGLLVLFDGAFYQDKEMIPGPVILDNLIAKKKIPPLVAVFIKHNPASRNKDLSCSEPFADFLVKELIPWVRGQYRVSVDPARTIVGGLSLGGLMASYCGLRHSDVFGNVLSQSGSYWWYPGGLEQDDRDLPKAEPGWLTREYVAAPRRAVRFYLEIGRFEEGGGFISGTGENRHFRDVLKAKGYSVHYSQYCGGHDYAGWRGSFADGLMELTGANANK